LLSSCRFDPPVSSYESFQTGCATAAAQQQPDPRPALLQEEEEEEKDKIYILFFNENQIRRDTKMEECQGFFSLHSH